MVYYDANETVYPIENGKLCLTITGNSHSTFRGSIAPAQLDYTVTFVSGEEPEFEVHDFGLLTVWLLDHEEVPYPYYNAQGAKPVQSARLSVWQGDHLLNTPLIYNEKYGNAHLGKKGLNFSAASSGNIRLSVSAPDWAIAYGISGSGSDFIYQIDRGLDISNDRNPVSAGQPINVYDEPLFKVVQAARAKVYLQQGIAARYGGYVFVFCWYDDLTADQPRLIEYVSITHDDFSEKVRNPMLNLESQIAAPISEVTGIGDNSYLLVVRHDPQVGDRAIHYDLHIEDDRGITYSLSESTPFYIPYPAGLSYTDQNIIYQLYHFREDYGNCTLIPVEATPYGLRFTEDHLSPFVLQWDDSQPDDSPDTEIPKTGDHTPIAILTGLLLLSLLLLYGVRLISKFQ